MRRSQSWELSWRGALDGGEVSARLACAHRDGAFYNDANTGRLAEADMVDVRLTYGRDRWSVSLYGENMLDDPTWGGDTVLASIAAFGYAGASAPTFSPLNKGRVIGLELRAQLF